MPNQLIPPEDLADMRAAQVEAMPDLSEIIRHEETPTNRGTFVPTEVSKGLVPCRLIAMGPDQERIYADQLRNRQAFILLMPYGTDLESSDDVIINGDKFDVIDIISGQSWQTVLKVIIANFQK